MIALLILLAGFVSFLLWRAMGGRPDFDLRIRGHRVECVRGEVPGSFLHAGAEVARIAGLRRGRIRGYLDGNSVHLRFSSAVPETVRQRFRNVWPHDATPGPHPPRSGGPRRRARG